MAGKQVEDVIRGRLGYERLPTFCYVCGIIGHGEIECPKNKADEGEQIASRQYGDWLRASPGRKQGANRFQNGVGLKDANSGQKKLEKILPVKESSSKEVVVQ